jgi:predicted ester cyclase
MKQHVERWFRDGLNKMDWNSVQDIFKKDFVYHGGDRDFTFSELQDRVNEYRQEHPDLRFNVDFVVEHGDRVGVTWTAQTKSKTEKGVGVATFKNGECVEFCGVMPNL